MPWLRRRSLHRELAQRLEDLGAPGIEVSTHWVAARDDERARTELLRALCEFETAHAYRDAALMRRPRAGALAGRGGCLRAAGAALERHAGLAELAGELADAAQSWREMVSIRRAAG